MQPTKETVQSLFERERQYIIPLYQRHYVWDEKTQWEPLWDDITTKADKRERMSQQGGGTHFTGAIVIQQKLTHTSEVTAYEIIDGQQRLTTFQIILCAFRGVCQKERGDKFKRLQRKAERLLANPDAEEDNKHKLKPTKFDRAAMGYLVSHLDPLDQDAPHSRLIDAYKYFYGNIRAFVGSDEKVADALLTAISKDFGFVEILVDGDDEPEMIFESLNARGKPLEQFDLLRNYLFLRTRQSEGEDRDALYEKYWEHFETDRRWDSSAKVARSKMPLSELFLQHFLMAKLARDDVHPLFLTYRGDYSKRLLDESQTRNELPELHKYSQEYLPLAINGHDSDVGRATQMYHHLDITSLRPFFLYLLAEVGVSGEKRERIFRALESYTVRRVLCTPQGHRDYNKFFSGMIKNLQGGFTERKFLDLLIGQERESDARKWHRDKDVRDAFGGRWSAIGVNRNIVRYILYRIECQLRSENPRTESVALPFAHLTLEHILPEGWKDTWALPLDNGEVFFGDIYTDEYKQQNSYWFHTMPEEGFADKAYAKIHKIAMERADGLQSVGNLTLLTRPLNASAKNAAFDAKKHKIRENSLLFLNREVCNEEIWDVAQIREREKYLCEIFCQIWPDAQWFVDNIPDGDD